MLEIDVMQLIAQGEGTKTEFKRDDVRPEALAKEITALANVHGGIILLGVEDDGQISGITKGNLQEWLMDAVIGQYTHPINLPDYDEVRIDEKTVAVVTVHEGMGKPYVVRQNNREDIYMRMGSTCQLATREQTARLFDRGGLLATDKLPVPGSSLHDLDIYRVKDYFSSIYDEDPDEATLVDWLTGRDLMCPLVGNDVCTIAGLVLFGKRPSRRLPQASIRMAVYNADDKVLNATMDKDLSAPFVGSRELENYATPSTPEQVVELLQPHISKEVMKGMNRIRQWDYPKNVIRELVINAFAHRDWTRNTDTEISVYNDRMEIISSGALPNGMTIEKLKGGQRVPRNNNIINVLRDYGLMEHQGMGIRRIVIPTMRKHNNTEPEFEATEDLVKVTLRK
ncbi:MAG: RNA-binding domain-containing protein [Pseudomonadales bacterium]